MDNNNKSYDLPTALQQYTETVLAGRNMAANTRVAYTADVSHLIDYLITRHLCTHPEAVNRSHLEAYAAYLDQLGLKGTTRYRKVMAIKSFFHFLTQQGVIEHSPAQQLIPPTREQKQPRWLSEAEYTRLLRAADHHPRDKAILELLLQTGMRLSEIARLSIQDVDLPRTITKHPDNTGSATILTKGRKTRTIGLNYKACLALRAYLDVRPKDALSAHLFLTKYKNAISGRSIEKLVAKYLQAANIQGASVHTIRHTFGTHQAKQGTPLPVIRDIMGHANIATTSVYLATSRADQDKALQEHAL